MMNMDSGNRGGASLEVNRCFFLVVILTPSGTLTRLFSMQNRGQYGSNSRGDADKLLKSWEVRK